MDGDLQGTRVYLSGEEVQCRLVRRPYQEYCIIFGSFTKMNLKYIFLKELSEYRTVVYVTVFHEWGMPPVRKKPKFWFWNLYSFEFFWIELAFWSLFFQGRNFWIKTSVTIASVWQMAQLFAQENSVWNLTLLQVYHISVLNMRILIVACNFTW